VLIGVLNGAAMGGRRRLRAGAPRLLGLHGGVRGRWYRECWAALLTEYGPLDGLPRLEAGRVCVEWVQLRTATAALEDARRRAVEGRGRRPGPRELERLARRAGLADASYGQGLDKLAALCAARKQRPVSALEALEQHRREIGS
jgi:hypothetical protein